MTLTLPQPSMPEEEAKLLLDCYQAASVILEYGSGASTRIAASLLNKRVFSVESDKEWARNLRAEISENEPKSKVTVHYVNIGKTASWGRVRDTSGWSSYHSYPNSIWDYRYFRHPDVILIDGRFRTACLMTALLRSTRPVIVLFDDYADRPKYNLVERIVRPSLMAGRMARFDIVPGMVDSKDISFVIEQYFQVTVHGQGASAYQLDDLA